MYHYLGFRICENTNIKKFYISNIISSENYLFRKEDNVKDKILESLEVNNKNNDMIDGYLIFDSLGIKQIEYLCKFLTWEYVDEINTSIIERLAKQIILLKD